MLQTKFGNGRAREGARAEEAFEERDTQRKKIGGRTGFLATQYFGCTVGQGSQGTAGLIRVLRATLLDELRKQYVVTARAKGVQERALLFKYPIRIAMNPVFSTIGWLLPSLISGQVIVGIVLNLQTIGPVLLRATLAQDMFLAGAIVLILGTLTVIGTLISDVCLAWLDPRIRLGGAEA